MTTDRTLLDVRDVTLRFGGVTALEHVDLAVGTGDICGLVGPNGAGKTSLFNCVSGYYRPTEGSIRLDGHDLLSEAPSALVRRGVARTFQHPNLQESRSLLDNILLGGHSRMRQGFASCLFSLPAGRREERVMSERAVELAARLRITDPLTTPAGDLPYGTQKRVEVARALMAGPRLLLLDEPASGLTHSEVDELGRLIGEIRDQLGVTIVIVEHHMGLIASITDHVVALVSGRKVAEGPAASVQSDPVVIAAYLGAA